MRYRLAILVVPALLAGCASHETAPPVVAAPIGRIVPDDQLTCAPEPDGTAVRNVGRDRSNYIRDLAAAGSDCRTKLDTTRSILKGEQ